MDATSAEIRLLEEISGRAWPPREQASGAGWEARFSDGMHRRVNSATVWPDAPDVGAVVASIEAWFGERRHPPIFKMTGASAPGLDDLLARRGYRVEATTLV